MNENEIGRIAAAINQLRPDWPTGSIRTLLAGPKLKDRPRRDVAVALTWVACETDSKTPARVNEPGPWWKATSAEGGEDQRWAPPKDHQACGKHPGEWRDRCRCCTADKLAGEVEESLPKTPADEAKAAARAAIAAAKTVDAEPTATPEDGAA